MKRLNKILIDMDCIMVDILPYWIGEYNYRTKENVNPKEITDYNFRKFCSQPEIMDEILHEPGFFLKLAPMPHAIEYFQQLVSDGFDVVIVTQPPRNAKYAVEDKRNWIKEYLPNFCLSNVIFCHRKELVRGDVLFDDKPTNLTKWKESNLNGITATIEWPYNTQVHTDWRFYNHETAWMKFYASLLKNNFE